MVDQIPYQSVQFPDAALAQNPSQRCPVILLLDVSGSMQGEPILALNQGLENFKDSIIADPLAVKRVDLSVITFGSTVTVEHGFSTIEAWMPPTLQANGQTAMGEALTRAMEELKRRKAEYRAAGIAYYRPWIFLITDGAPSDAWQAPAQELHDGQAKNNFMFFAVGVGNNVDMETLGKISPPGRQPLSLKGLAFRELFSWLSTSMKAVSRSRVDDKVPLENPAGPAGWASA